MYSLLPNTVTMQRNTDASLEYLKKKAPPLKSQESEIAKEGFHGTNEDINCRLADFVDSSRSINIEGYRPIQQRPSIPFYHQDFFLWPIISPSIQMQQPYHMNVVDNHFFPTNREGILFSENQIHAMPFNKMVPQVYPHELWHQDFQYFVVIDFEATCDRDNRLHPQEIIEFPSVLVNSFTGLLEASFQTYVRPAQHQVLTDFCKELTGIQQIQVDRGVTLNEALLMHDKWLEDKGIKHKSFAVVTWSDWDCRVMLESECRFKGIRKPTYFNEWINLKVPFHEVFGAIRCNLKEAVQLAGLAWEGRAHCGLDDARNTARLLSLLMRRGFHFSITNSLKWHPSKPPESRIGPAVTKLKLNSQSPSFEPIEGGTMYCFCGVKSSKCIVRKPGPKQGKWFFGCGNWTPARRAGCDYFVWEETNKKIVS